MKTGWHNRPDNWPATLQIAIATLCTVPTLGFIVVHQYLLAIFFGLCALGFWCWLGRATRGFPLLFDILGLTVFSINGLAVLLAVIRLIRIAMIR
jgi:hypothetical protein